MAEAVAAFYAVETVVEGAAVGAYAVSQSTTPLNLRFRELRVPVTSSPKIKSVGHTLNVVKGKAYIFGGDSEENGDDTSITVLTLPSDIENGELDCQTISAEFETTRPLQAYASTSVTPTDSQGFQEVPTIGGTGQSTQTHGILSRAYHCSTRIGSDIFILSGRRPLRDGFDSQRLDSQDAPLLKLDHVCVFSTQMNKWSIIQADIQNCKGSIPETRTRASCTSTPHPQPDTAVQITTHAHGTIFLHGGYDAQGRQLRDTWTFDVSSRVWTCWPDIPDVQPEEVAGEGRIACVDKRLWRVGDGFGKMMYRDFDVLQSGVVGETSGPHQTEVGIKPEGTTWETLTFGRKAASTALPGKDGAEPGKSLIDMAERLPVPRQSAGFISVTPGAGRQFLLYFMGQDGPGSVLGDAWSFQINAENKSPAAVKDAIRKAVGRSTGENQWATCDIVESSKQDGQLNPPRGLTKFASDSWDDLGGGNVVLYGGVDASGQPVQQLWIMSVQ